MYPLSLRVHQFGVGVKSFIWLILLFGIATAVYYYVFLNEDNVNTQQYLTEILSQRDIQTTVLAGATLEAQKQVAVGAQVSGEISKLYVDIGDIVQQGDPIAEIDARTQTNTRDTAMTQLKIRQATLESAQASLREAQQKHERQRQLFARGATAKENLESAKTALDNANSSVEQAKLGVRQSQIEVDNAGLNLGYTSVNAPMAGVVISVAVEQGQTVNAVQAAPTIVTIAQLETMTVKAEIAEADVNKVHAGMTAFFYLLGDERTRYDTTLLSIDPAPTNISNNQTSTQNAIYYYGKMQVDNPDGRLRIGMTANTQIVVASAENVLSVPMTALQKQLDNNVYEITILDNGQPRQQTVTIGIDDGVYAEVLSGVSVGAEVVISTRSEQPSEQFHGPF